TGVYHNQSGGVLSVATIGNASTTNASFGITSSTGTSFITSGGTIILVQRNSGTLGATTRDYYVVATHMFSGGTLQVGTSATVTNFNFRLYGYAPNVTINNTTNNKKIEVYQTSGVLIISGDLTVPTGTTFDCLGMSAFVYGNVTNNGIIQGLTSGSRFDFSGSNPQTYSGTGTLGTLAAPFIGTGVGIGNPGNVTLNADIYTTRVNLFSGTFVNSNRLKLGIGGTSSVFIQRGGSSTSPAGSFDVAPTFNIGSGGIGISYYSAPAVITSGLEIPASRTLTSLTLNSSPGAVLSGGALSVGTFTMTLGNLTTSETNLLTITGTTTGSIAYTAGYINGPVARTLPLSLATGSTYLFPVGKSAYKPLELVNPTTNAGGTVVIRAEVFDGNCGGTTGTNMTSLNTDRYWNAQILSGGTNFTNTTIRLTDAGLTVNNGMAKSASQGGSYDLISTAAPTSTTILSDAVSSLGYLVIGIKNVPYTYSSGTATQASTANLYQGTVSQVVTGIQVVTSGNSGTLNVTKFTLNANGSTAASDISNAKIWYTGNSSTFAATNLFGTEASPSLTSYQLTGTQALTAGTNYFWLTYDIPANAVAGHTVDAECTLITVGGADYVPSVTAPAGSRTIVIDPPTNLTATATLSTRIALEWTRNTIGQNVVIATNTTSTFGTPVNGTPLNIDDLISGGGKVIYNGPLSAFEHNGLTPQTPYYYKAWSVDANNYYSTTGAAANATTPCSEVTTYPYTESFGAAFDCWTSAEGSTGASYHWEPVVADADHGAAGPQSGSYFARLNVFNAQTTYNPYYLVTKTFILGSGVKKVQYYYWLGSSGYKGTGGTDLVPLTLQISTNGGLTWTNLFQHTSSNSVFSATSSTDGWTVNSLELSAYANQTVVFRFMANSNYGYYFCNQGIDEFSVSEIQPPQITGLSATSGCVGSQLTINGTSLDLVSAVTIGGTPAAIVSKTATAVTVTVGTGTTGYVTVTTVAGSDTSDDPFTVNPLPQVFAVGGGGNYCEGTEGITITLSGSEAGITYTLSSIPPVEKEGNGGLLTFGPVALPSGQYSITANNPVTGCTNLMSGQATVVQYPAPAAITITPPSATLAAGATQQLVASGGNVTDLVLFSENFNSGAGSFTVTAGSSTALCDWTPRANGYVYSGYTFSGSTSGFMLANSDAGGSGSTTNTQLTSPSFSTAGITGVVLSFKEYLNNSTDVAAAVEVSDDNFVTSTILRNDVTNDFGTISSFITTVLPLPATFEGKPNVKIRFRYAGSYDWFWAVDELTVTGTLNAQFTWSPVDDLFTDPSATTAYTGTGNYSILWTKPQQSQTYTVTATTNMGCTRSQTVGIVSCPAVPGSVTAFYPAPNSFWLGWTYTGGSIPVNYTVEVATDDQFLNLEGGTPYTIDFPLFWCNVYGLMGSTQYFYRIKANTAECSSDWSATGSISTLCPEKYDPFREGFEGTAFPPPCWINTPETGPFAWARNTAASGYG
ncbi:MAG TPA: BNR-repeat neuraminidase N-terminal domain-containing protein, partial [Bacteroidales bacterium]|nr:BNR-repeat neuraminidase N-terminal domain-containing protein [Bacteroidales bacterium]